MLYHRELDVKAAVSPDRSVGRPRKASPEKRKKKPVSYSGEGVSVLWGVPASQISQTPILAQKLLSHDSSDSQGGKKSICCDSILFHCYKAPRSSTFASTGAYETTTDNIQSEMIQYRQTYETFRPIELEVRQHIFYQKILC